MFRKLFKDPFTRNWLISFLASAILIAVSMSGCSSEPEQMPPELMEIAAGATPHPWIHQQFWDDLAEDESGDYHFECAHGIPFIRYDFSTTPMMVPYYTTETISWHDYITKMMWQACGNMTTRQAERLR